MNSIRGHVKYLITFYESSLVRTLNSINVAAHLVVTTEKVQTIWSAQELVQNLISLVKML